MYAIAQAPMLPFVIPGGPRSLNDGRRFIRVPAVRGMGATGAKPAWGTSAAGGAAVGVSTGIATGSVLAGSIAGGLATIAPFTGPAAPFLLAAAAVVAPLASLFKGCGSTCTQATEYANQFSERLEQLKKLYWAQPVRYRVSQAQTLAYMDQAAEWLAQMCGNPALGAAGQRCISERLIEGGTAPWCPTSDHRGCDWVTTLRNPIANDAGVVDDPQSSSSPASSTLDALGIPNAQVGQANLSDLLLPAALMLGAWYLL
jgi:hypothetical protein